MAHKRKTDINLLVSSGAAAAPAPSRRRGLRSQHSNSIIETPVAPNIEPIASQPLAAPSEPTHRQIAILAYSYWQARGYNGGSAEAEQDWLRAERELRAR